MFPPWMGGIRGVPGQDPASSRAGWTKQSLNNRGTRVAVQALEFGHESMSTMDESWRIGIMLFDGFELLDVFGPVEIFGQVRDRFRVDLIGQSAGPVTSAQGPQVIADHAYDDAPACDIVLVPGGIGTRRLVADDAFLRRLGGWASGARFVTSVCTGSGVLAAAGLLDGYRATSNKRAFGWASEQGQDVEWVPQARWVEDRTRWTSSGVSAGMDMALALVERLCGEEAALNAADAVEYDWHRDPSWDPFAAKNGLVPG